MVPPVPLVQVRARIVLQHDGHVPLVVDVQQDRLDPRGAVPAGTRRGRRCPNASGQPDPAAPRDANPVDDTASCPGDSEWSAPGSHHRGARIGLSRRPSTSSATGRSERTAPCSRANTSSGRASTRSTIAFALGSVARASRFSSSVRVSVRSERISSISPASNRSPGLSGRDAGVVVHDDRGRQHHVPPARAPASTGNVCRFGTPSAASDAQAGGSSSDRKTPSCSANTQWVATRERRKHLGARRVDGLVAHRVLDDHAQPAQRGTAPLRPRSTAAGAPTAASGCAPPGRPRPIAQRLDLLPPGTVIGSTCSRSPSSASCDGHVELPAARPRRTSDGARRRSPARPPRRTRRRRRFARTERCCGCRNRSRTRSRAAASPRTGTRSAAATRPPSPQRVSLTGRRASTHSRGASTPNCQRTRFFSDDFRYG